MTNPKYELKKNGVINNIDNPYKITETIEIMLAKAIGMSISLDHSIDPDTREYAVFMHSSNDHNLSDKQIDLLDSDYGMKTEDDENTHLAIMELLNTSVEPVIITPTITNESTVWLDHQPHQLLVIINDDSPPSIYAIPSDLYTKTKLYDFEGFPDEQLPKEIKDGINHGTFQEISAVSVIQV